MTSTTTGPSASPASPLPSAVSAACRRDTPTEKPVAGTSSPHEAADEAVIAPAAADRAEADGAALFVFHLEGELGLEDGAGVVFEAADDGRIDSTRSDSSRPPTDSRHFIQLLAIQARPGCAIDPSEE